MAALFAPPPGEGGHQLHYEGDWQLHRVPGSPDHGKSPNLKFQGASLNE